MVINNPLIKPDSVDQFLTTVRNLSWDPQLVTTRTRMGRPFGDFYWDNLGTWCDRRTATTHLKFNTAPEKWWLEDDPFLLGFGNFWGANG